MFIEALHPPFHLVFSPVPFLIAAVVHQHHWNISAKDINDKIHFSWVVLMITGVSTVMSVGLGLDILHGSLEANESDIIGWLPSTAWFFSIVAILEHPSLVSNNDRINWIHLTLDSGLHTIRQFCIGLIDSVRFRNRPERADEPIQLKGVFANIIMPIMAVAIFMMLYGGINEAFDASTNVMFEWIGWMFTQVEYIDLMLPLSTLLLGGFILPF